MEAFFIILFLVIAGFLLGQFVLACIRLADTRRQVRKLTQEPTPPKSIQHLDKAIELRKLAETLDNDVSLVQMAEEAEAKVKEFAATFNKPGTRITKGEFNRYHSFIDHPEKFVAEGDSMVWPIPPPGNAGVKHAKTRELTPKEVSVAHRAYVDAWSKMSREQERAHVNISVDFDRVKKSIAAELDRLTKPNNLLDVDPFGLKKAHAIEVDRRAKLADAFSTEPGALWLLHDGVVSEAWHEAHLFDECSTLMAQVQEDDAQSFYESRLLKIIDLTFSNARVSGMRSLLGEMRHFVENYDTGEITYIENWGGEVQRIVITPMWSEPPPRTWESVNEEILERKRACWQSEKAALEKVKRNLLNEHGIAPYICTPPQRTEQEP